MGIERARIIELARFGGPRGELTAIEIGRDVPFPIRRIFYISGVPAGATRGGHAHRSCEELLVAVGGSFKVDLDDGEARRSFELDRRDRGLYVPPMVWGELRDFSADAVCLVLASESYEESDYLRDRDAFVGAARSLA